MDFPLVVLAVEIGPGLAASAVEAVDAEIAVAAAIAEPVGREQSAVEGIEIGGEELARERDGLKAWAEGLHVGTLGSRWPIGAALREEMAPSGTTMRLAAVQARERKR